MGEKIVLTATTQEHPMKRSALNLTALLLTSPLLVQCAAQDDINTINNQIYRVNQRVTNLENNTIEDLVKRQASTANKVDSLERDLIALRNGLEETGYLNRKLSEQNKELTVAFQQYTTEEQQKRASDMQKLEAEITEKDRQLEVLAQQLQMQEKNLEEIQRARVEDAKRKAAEAARAAQEARAKAQAAAQISTDGTIVKITATQNKKLFNPAAQAPPPTTSQAPSTVAPAATATGSLANARDLYDQGEYRQAYQAYANIANSEPAGDDAIDALFMMGESRYAQGEYDQAILEYQTIITGHPASTMASTAMFKQAMSFEKLNDKETAKILYKKLLATYPGSPEAGQAQQRLDALN
jgi:tol-pal system protein YbgF